MEKIKKEGKIMKIVLVLYLILFSFSSVFSQDFTKEYEKKTLLIDSLQKQVIKPLNDSIIKLNSSHKSEVSKFQEQIANLKNDTLELSNKVKDLEVQATELGENKLKVERDSFQTKVESLSAKVVVLKKIISQKEKQIEKEIEKGKQEVLKQIIQTYNKPFDEIIKSSAISSVERDLLIVGNYNESTEKLLNLQKYFLAKQVLSEKYNEQKVNSALAQIDSLTQTESVKKLTGLLGEYELCNAGLKTTIGNILEIDKQFVANDDYNKNKKLENILAQLSWYFRNYRFSFSDYPYLSDIVLEIMKQKQKDANKNISYLLDEL